MQAGGVSCDASLGSLPEEERQHKVLRQVVGLDRIGDMELVPLPLVMLLGELVAQIQYFPP